jgi:DNA-binding transcriptional MerR regulator
MDDTTAEGYTVAQTEKLTGLSRAMLDYLCRSEVLRPNAKPCRGRGHRRLYSFSDLVLLRVIARLLRSGISVLKLKNSLATLRRRYPEFATRRISGAILVTDGARIYLRQGAQVIEDLVGGQLAFAFVIELDGLKRELGRRVDASRSPKPSRRKPSLASA